MTLADVVAALGVLMTAPAMAGMGLTLLGGRAPYDLLVGTVVLGVVLTIAGLVPRFEQHRLGWASQTDALLRARQQARRTPDAPGDQGPAGSDRGLLQGGQRLLPQRQAESGAVQELQP
ncbi:hypothetical protein BJF77_09545 [Kocuria sp. CNJ-770]|jgi:hypothetical protein|nr:hypothetical protein ABL57_08845 [Kocuria sp. SM24M-10]OLT09701.1 hypothetical protein BJF77_09545 [Kocuria sp. CNJ-770]